MVPEYVVEGDNYFLFDSYLSSMSHCIESKEIIFSDVELVSEVLKARLLTKTYHIKRADPNELRCGCFTVT